MDLLKNLNENQKKAVTLTEGPVMVMAGAGSGKTKVLTTRISYIIQELGIAPSQILAVTFTNKAALEMKSRIEAMLGIQTGFMWISTFHSFCARLLRQEIDKMPPFNKNFTIIDEDDSIKIIKDVLEELGIVEKPKTFKLYISRNKNFINYEIRNPMIRDYFESVNRRYEEKCKQNNLLDFDDLIIYTIKLLDNFPDVLKKYQNIFRYILVDEFQDTNDLQYQLMKMIASLHHNLFVVGDDFQSIYSFRGAMIENINHFRKDFPNYKLVLLEQNYRSTTQILNLANDVIKHNTNQIQKEMFTVREDGKLPYYYRGSTAHDEVYFVINKIKDMVNHGRSYSDIAIMYRVNYISRVFEEELKKNHIPFVLYGGTPFFSRMEIKDMIAYLRILIHKDDDFSFERIINVPKRKIGKAILDKLRKVAEEKNISLYEAIDDYKGSGIGYENLKKFKVILEGIKATIESGTLSDILEQIVNQFEYEKELKKDEISYLDRMENIEEFKSTLTDAEEEFVNLSNFEKLENKLADLALTSDEDDNDEFNSVRLTTFHQVKGLEFPVVFMVAMEKGIFPPLPFKQGFSNDDEGVNNNEMEEERRVCYVGITRAMDELYLTSAKTRKIFGEVDENRKESIFISEMDKSLYATNFNRVKAVDARLKPFKNLPKTSAITAKPTTKSLFFIGDKVNHKIFGDGMVVKIEGDIISVAFPHPTGIKKLKANHPSIRKL